MFLNIQCVRDVGKLDNLMGSMGETIVYCFFFQWTITRWILFLAKEKASDMASPSSRCVHPIVCFLQLFATEYQANATNLYHKRLGILGHRHSHGIHFGVFEVKMNIIFFIWSLVHNSINIFFQQFASNAICTTNSSTTTLTNSRNVCGRYADNRHLHWNPCIKRIPDPREQCILVTYVLICCFQQHTHLTIC